MKLYTVTIRGYKYYFYGNLSTEAINSIENVCINLERNSKSDDAVILFEYLVKHITLDLRFPITPVNVEHIFRINY